MYGTIAGGDTYFTTRLNITPWSGATDANKTAALTMSSAAIDRLNFVGELADEDQAAQFPRGDDTTVPDAITNACYENSLSLLDDVDPEYEAEIMRMSTMSFGSVKNTYDLVRTPMHFLHGIASGAAWLLIKPFLRDANTINLRRV